MSSVIALLLLSGTVYGETNWDSLKTTWNINPFAGFYDVPLTRSEAEDEGWEQLLSCASTDSPGNVYYKDDDLSSMPVYNAYGNIAGIILGMLNPGASYKNGNSAFTEYTMTNGTTFWGVQGNFKDPQYTCDDSTPEADYTSGDVGDGLWIVNGNHASDFVAPLIEDRTELTGEGWKRGACFWAMGQHYWRYVDDVDMDCDDYYPVFLLYTKGKLNAWGIALAHEDRPNLSTKRWEHPQGGVLNKFFQKGEVPKCLPLAGKLSTQHIFMTNPAFNTCSLW